MKLEEAVEKGISFLRDPGGYFHPELLSIERVGELWSSTYKVGMKGERVELLLGDDRIMGFRQLKDYPFGVQRAIPKAIPVGAKEMIALFRLKNGKTVYLEGSSITHDEALEVAKCLVGAFGSDFERTAFKDC